MPKPKSVSSHAPDALAMADTFELFLIKSGILARGVEVGLQTFHSQEHQLNGTLKKCYYLPINRLKTLSIFGLDTNLS